MIFSIKNDSNAIFKTTKTYNEYGSIVNHILCHYENKILQLLVQHIQQKDIEICALMFDGLMVYGDYYKDDSLLKELEEVIKDYGIQKQTHI